MKTKERNEGKPRVRIEDLIELAGFEVSEGDKQGLEKELADFLAYAEVINAAPSAGFSPASHAVEKAPALRDDVVAAWERLDSLLDIAPAIQGTSYLVPPQRGRTGSGEDREQPAGTGSAASAASDLPAGAGGAAWEAVIGLEVHAQLRTKSKLFCSCSASFGAEPNRNTCPVCSGHPGVLPVLNREAVDMAILAGLACSCTINRRSVFARKNYFYPDLPKGYQISQFEEPVCSGGHIEIETEGGRKRVGLNRIHMEEDAVKMVHVGAPGIWGSKASAVDLNRSSVPLIEIVSEPDLSSPREAREYVVMLRAILVSLGICDGNMEEGSLRCDANVSIRPVGSTALGVKVEIKNMNSFKASERALDFEIARLKRLAGAGRTIGQETRLWDESSQKTFLMRTKEESHDYRYFPDPDLLPLVLSDEWIDSVSARLVPLPLERKRRYMTDYQFTADEARLFMHNPEYARLFERIMEEYDKPRILANWFFSEFLGYLPSSASEAEFHLDPADIAGFLRKVDSGEITGKIAKNVIRKSFAEKRSLLSIIADEGLRRMDDTAEIERIAAEILSRHPAQTAEYRGGKEKLFGFFVGEVMKATHGKANPETVNRILGELLKRG